MTTLISNENNAAQAVDRLMIRIVQPGVDVRCVTLPAGKCTIGSSDRCQVHLIDSAVRPLHCLILHEQSETSITRWAPGALLNGQDFATAPFRPGDSLQIGDVQLSLEYSENDSTESLASSHKPTMTAKPPRTAAPSAFAVSLEETPLTADVPEPDGLVDHLKSSNQIVRRRCQNLVRSLRAERDGTNALQQDSQDTREQLAAALLEREQLASQLALLESTASEQSLQSNEEIDLLAAELAAAHEKAALAESELTKVSSHSEELQTELASLREQKEHWAQARSASELQRSKLAEALAEREHSVESLQDEIARLRQAATESEATHQEQLAETESLRAELERTSAERDELAISEAESRQSQQDAETELQDTRENMEVLQLEVEKLRLTSGQIEQELAERNSSFEDLEAECHQLAQERDALIAQRTEYQLQLQGWEHEVSDRDAQIEQASTEIDQLRVQIDECNQKVSQQEVQQESVQQQLRAVVLERDQLLEAQVEQVQTNVEWEEAVIAREQRIKELEAEHEAICQILQSVEKGAFEQVDACNQLEQQLAKVRQERDQLASGLPELQEYITELQQTIAERDDQISLLSEETTRNSLRQLELETELTQSTSTHQALQNEFNELSSHCEQLIAAQSVNDQTKAVFEQTTADYIQQIESLQNELADAQQARQELEAAAAESSESHSTNQVELADLRARNEQLAADHQSERDQRVQLSQQLAERQQHIELFQVDLKSVQRELARNVEQVSSLQEERATLLRQLEGLREELASLRESGETETSQLQQQHDERAHELEEAQTRLAEFQRQADAATAAAVENQSKIEQLENEKSRLTQQIAEQQQQTENLATELQQAQLGLQAAEQALQDGLANSEIEHESSSMAPDPLPESESSTGDSIQSADEVPVDPDSDGLAELATGDGKLTENDVEESGPTQSASTPFDVPEPEPAEPKEEFKPTSFIDQYQHLLEADENAPFEPASPQPKAKDQPEHRLKAEIDAMDSAQEVDSGEVDLEAYMSNMMRRMRGEKEIGNAPATQSRGTTPEEDANTRTALKLANDLASAEATRLQEEQDAGPLDLEQLKQSSHKPALPTDIFAMRELANSSARRAIAKSHRRRYLERMLVWLAFCLIFVSVGGYSVMIAMAAQEFLGLKFVGGVTAVLVGFFGGLNLLGILFQAIREGSGGTRATANIVSPSNADETATTS